MLSTTRIFTPGTHSHTRSGTMHATLLPSPAPHRVHAPLHRPKRRDSNGAKSCARGDGGGGARRGALGAFGGFFGKLALGGGGRWAKEKAEVMRLAEEQRRGVGHSKEDRAAMEAAIDALVAAAGGPGGGGAGAATSSKRLSANWRLAWTSEQETLFLLENFPGDADGVLTQAYQNVDVDAATLGNAVVFSNGNTFAAGGPGPRLPLPHPPMKRVAFGEGCHNSPDDTTRAPPHPHLLTSCSCSPVACACRLRHSSVNRMHSPCSYISLSKFIKLWAPGSPLILRPSVRVPLDQRRPEP